MKSAQVNGSDQAIQAETSNSGFITYSCRFSVLVADAEFDSSPLALECEEAFARCKQIQSYFLFSIFLNIIYCLLDKRDSLSAERNEYNLILMLKAARHPVLVPPLGTEASPESDYQTKVRLLKELSELPKEDFFQTREIFEWTLKVIDYHLFYRFDEYYKFMASIIELDDMEEIHGHHEHMEHHEHRDPFEVFESCWEVYLKPMYSILQKVLEQSSLSNSYKIEAGFAGALVKLITSPLEVESKLASRIIQKILTDSSENNGVVLRVVTSSLNALINQVFVGKIIPFLVVESLSRFFADLMNKLRFGPKIVVDRMLSMVRTNFLPLYKDERLYWFHEPLSHLLVQYFTNFEVEPGREIKRTPFEPLFPESSPFVNNSEIVNEFRDGLLQEMVFFDGSGASSLHNQMARFSIMHNLCQFQFFPRDKILLILTILEDYFLKTRSVECASYIVVFFNLKEVFSFSDPVDRIILQAIIEEIDQNLDEDCCAKIAVLRNLKGLMQNFKAISS